MCWDFHRVAHASTVGKPEEKINRAAREQTTPVQIRLGSAREFGMGKWNFSLRDVYLKAGAASEWIESRMGKTGTGGVQRISRVSDELVGKRQDAELDTRPLPSSLLSLEHSIPKARKKVLNHMASQRYPLLPIYWYQSPVSLNFRSNAHAVNAIKTRSHDSS